MSYLIRERETLARYLPQFDPTLAARSLEELERPDGTAIKLLRATRGASLLVPSEVGGLGADARSAIHVQRAIGARAPSLAVATTMHHFSVATLLQYSLYDSQGSMMLGLVASHGYLVASGFAEGRSGASVLDAAVTAEWTGASYRLRGSKKPCSLSRSMDLLSAGVTVIRGNLPPMRGVAVLFGTTPGLERRPFWQAPVLAATESDELVLDGIEVPSELVIILDGPANRIHPVEVGGLCWFTLLISASYLGIASGLVERVLVGKRGSASERMRAVQELEAAMASLEGLAARFATERLDERLLAETQLVRYAVQDAIERATAHAVELLGGLAFVRAKDVAYLLAASRALAFHPPSRSSALEGLLPHFAGAEQGGDEHVAA